jgi:hypothetical protein
MRKLQPPGMREQQHEQVVGLYSKSAGGQGLSDRFVHKPAYEKAASHLAWRKLLAIARNGSIKAWILWNEMFSFCYNSEFCVKIMKK